MLPELKEGDLVWTPEGNPGVVVSKAKNTKVGVQLIKVCSWMLWDDDDVLNPGREVLDIYPVGQLKPRERES